MACGVSGVIGVMEDNVSGGLNYSYHRDDGNTLWANIAVHDPIACCVIDISVNNGDYTKSASNSPFKFQWADVSTKSTTTALATTYQINTALQSITVAEDTVVPVFDQSQNRWEDVYAKNLASSPADVLAVMEMDSSSDGDACGVAAISSITSQAVSDKRTIVTVATADYILVGITNAKPAILVSGCQGSAVNDATGGALGGP